MAFDIHNLFAYSTVASITSQSGTTLIIVLQAGDGALFSVGQQVTIGPANTQLLLGNAMVGRITAISTDTLTIDYSTKNKEGSNTRTVLGGDAVLAGITPKIFKDLEPPLLPLPNFVASGLTIPTSASLAATCAAGVLWYGNTQISVASDGGHTYTASKDTYVDVDNTGAYTYSAVTNGAAAPALTANSLRIAKVVSGASTITAVTQDGSIDSIGNILYPSDPRVVTTKYYTPSAGGTVTLDFTGYAKRHIIQMPAGNITIALPSGVIPFPFFIEIVQDGTGGRTVTWFTTIDWPSAAPTLSTGASKKDTFAFLSRISGTYDGYVVGQNL